MSSCLQTRIVLSNQRLTSLLLQGITCNPQSLSQGGGESIDNAYLECSEFDFTVSSPNVEQAATSASAADGKRKREEVAGDDYNHSWRRRVIYDLVPSFRRAAFPALQAQNYDVDVCVSHGPHAEALVTLVASSKLGSFRRDKVSKLVRKLLSPSNLLGMPAHWGDEFIAANLSGHGLHYDELPMHTLIERK